MAKAQSDYGRLQDDAEIRRDGLQIRVDKFNDELNRLLGNHPDAERIRQLLARGMANVVKLTDAKSDVERYSRLAQVQREEAAKAGQPVVGQGPKVDMAVVPPVETEAKTQPKAA